MNVGLLLAVPDDRESELVRLADTPGTGLTVVRRCADLAELVAAARAGLGGVAVVSVEVDGVDRTAVAAIQEHGVPCVIIAPRAESPRCEAMGAAQVSAAEDDPARWVETLQAVAQGVRNRAGAQPSARAPGAVTDHDEGAAPAAEATAGDDRGGRVVVVWGPRGAPGRTTVALNLAAELHRLDGPALLVDADTEAPSVAQALGLLDETSGIAAVCRAAAQGRLETADLERVCQRLEDGMLVLSGLTRPDRWRELPGSSLSVVWERVREVAGWTVVDVSAGLDEPGPAQGRRRHEAGASALTAADVVVVVGAAEPVSMTRLVRALAELDERGLLRPGLEATVLVNRVRSDAAGARPREAVRESLARFAGILDPVIVPDDRSACDTAMLGGRSLLETEPGSPAREALLALAEQLTGVRRRRRPAKPGRRQLLGR